MSSMPQIDARTEAIMAATFDQEAFTPRQEVMSRQLIALPSGSSNSLVRPPQPKGASSTRTWRPPPSRTTGEFVPRFGLRAPLFNGDDPLGWIFGIQDYFNHYLISEPIRLELVDKLIEYPASNWFYCYQQNNVDGSWEEFLVAVCHHFAPELFEEEPPDPPAAATMKWGWQLPPSVTQAPPGVLPCLRFDAPRFDGDNALDWILKIQNYYNHQYTPLPDRLYLTQYLFDHPASEWMAYWEENNKGKGWDEFLIAVKQRFEPDLHDEYVGHLPALRQTSSVDVVPTPPASVGPTPPAPVDPTPPLEVTVTAQDFEVEDEKQEINTAHSISSGFEVADHSPPPMPSVFTKSSVFIDRVEVSDSSRSLNDLSTSIGAVIRTADSKTRFHMTPVREVDATGKYNPSTSTVPSPMPAASPTTTRIKLKCDVEGDDDPPYVEFAQPIKDPRLEQALTADGRSIPPRNVVTRLDRSFSTSWRPPGSRTAGYSQNSLLDLMDSKTMEVTYHGNDEWRCATLQSGHATIDQFRVEFVRIPKMLSPRIELFVIFYGGVYYLMRNALVGVVVGTGGRVHQVGSSFRGRHKGQIDDNYAKLFGVLCVAVRVKDQNEMMSKEKKLPLEGCALVAGRRNKRLTALGQVGAFYTCQKNVKAINCAKGDKKLGKLFHLHPMREDEIRYFIGVQLNESQLMEILLFPIPHKQESRPLITLFRKRREEALVSTAITDATKVESSSPSVHPSWELANSPLQHFPNLRLEDKAILLGRGVDRDSTSTRHNPDQSIERDTPKSPRIVQEQQEQRSPKSIRPKPNSASRPQRTRSKSARHKYYCSK